VASAFSQKEQGNVRDSVEESGLPGLRFSCSDSTPFRIGMGLGSWLGRPHRSELIVTFAGETDRSASGGMLRHCCGPRA